MVSEFRLPLGGHTSGGRCWTADNCWGDGDGNWYKGCDFGFPEDKENEDDLRLCDAHLWSILGRLP